MLLVYHYLIIPALPTESRGPILEQHRPKNANLSETGLNWSIRISWNRFSLGQLHGFQLVFVPIEFKVFKNLVLTKVEEVVRIRIPLQPVLAKARPLANGKTLDVAARKEWPHAYLKIGSNEPKQMVTKSTYIKLYGVVLVSSTFKPDVFEWLVSNATCLNTASCCSIFTTPNTQRSGLAKELIFPHR